MQSCLPRRRSSAPRARTSRFWRLWRTSQVPGCGTSTGTCGAGQARVRLLLSRPGALNVELSPAPQSSRWPVTLTADLDPVDSAQRWLYHKTTHRELYDQRVARHQNSDDVVLINERGQITETTIANIAVRINERWWTPPVDVGCLPGVERGRLLELGLLGERTLTLDDLRRAEALAVISSLRGWQPALLIDAG